MDLAASQDTVKADDLATVRTFQAMGDWRPSTTGGKLMLLVFFAFLLWADTMKAVQAAQTTASGSSAPSVATTKKTVKIAATATHRRCSRHHATSTKKTVSSIAASADVKVRVNTSTGVYHLPGTRWYGATKYGTYMTEAAARAKGDRAAENNQ